MNEWDDCDDDIFPQTFATTTEERRQARSTQTAEATKQQLFLQIWYSQHTVE